MSIKQKVEENVKYGINQKKQKGMTMVKDKCLRACAKTKRKKEEYSNKLQKLCVKEIRDTK